MGLLSELPSPFIGWSSAAFRNNTFRAFGLIGLVLFAFSRPSLRDVLIVLAAGGAAALGCAWAFGLTTVLPADAAHPPLILFGHFAGLAGMLSIHARAGRQMRASEAAEPLRYLLGAVAFALLYALFSGTFLAATVIFHPRTFDGRLLFLDSLLGWQPSVATATFVGAHEGVKAVLQVAYQYMYAVFLFVLGVQAREGWRQRGWHGVEVWFVISMIGMVAYHLMPVCGPLYAFPEAFPGAMPGMDKVPLDLMPVAPAMRNGVPSLHFGWSLAAWIVALSLKNRWLKWGSGVLMLSMVPATLGLGEHYLLDLVVALPFVIGVMALLVRGEPVWSPPRRVVFAAMGGLYVFWMWFLLAGYLWLARVPGLVPVMAVVTLVASAWALRTLLGVVAGLSAVAGGAVAAPRRAVREGGGYVVLFFLSGLAALIYEVLFAKRLAVVFGSSSLATYTVLATYMGGMALGAWLGGCIAQTRRQLVERYVQCELGIAVYCLVTPFLFDGALSIYTHLAADAPVDATWVVGLRFALGALVLSVPTVLMGMTLPILIARLDRRQDVLGVTVSRLYGANTLGAALGALLAGYLIIPMLGLTATNLVAVIINLLVALSALGLRRSDAAAAEAPAVAAPVQPARPAQAPRWAVLLALGGVGLICLALETLYIHMLAIVAGNSTYAFSLMLFAFLVGLGGGAVVWRRVPGVFGRPVLAMCVVLLLLALTLRFGMWQWEAMSDYFARFQGYPLPFSFAGRELVRGAVCVLVLFPPAFLLGAFFPLAMDHMGRHGGGRMLGLGVAVNTLGNILGVFVGAYVLLPWVGGVGGVQILAAFAILLAMVLGQASGLPGLRLKAGALVAGLAVVTAPAELDYGRVASGANVYFADQRFGPVIDRAESSDGGLTAVHESPGADGRVFKTLTTNGKFQGNDSGEMEAQAGFAMVPLRFVTHRDSALVIGYGTGMTANLLRHAGFTHLDIVDLSRDIVELADRHFPQLNEGVSRADVTRMHIADGRNFLLLQRRSYDLITVELTSIWFAGAAASYNREFYQLVKSRLGDSGVLQQWVQLHHITQRDLLAILASVRTEFRNVKLFQLGGQGMIVASDAPDERLRGQDGGASAEVDAFVSRLFGHNVRVSPELLLETDGVDLFLSNWGDPEEWASTDENMYLEYATPKGNMLDGGKSYQFNIAVLRQYGKVAAMKKTLEARQ
ncbi:fused MFS/spermidine synthase [Zoogloea sp. 1C4]|uniref:fused MFS/spermidine synthase n=1 Tax=Zoogloea sp. 1C4 TaxID=2570190 RepID=UPI0018856C69|nr:fused MFS/spermidine synthase [Zoogloea sp. 1C4]